MSHNPTRGGYRLYLLRSDGRNAGPYVEFSVTTDEKAIVAATTLGAVGPYQLRKRGRLVQCFNFNDTGGAAVDISRIKDL